MSPNKRRFGSGALVDQEIERFEWFPAETLCTRFDLSSATQTIVRIKYCRPFFLFVS